MLVCHRYRFPLNIESKRYTLMLVRVVRPKDWIAPVR